MAGGEGGGGHSNDRQPTSEIGEAGFQWRLLDLPLEKVEVVENEHNVFASPEPLAVANRRKVVHVITKAYLQRGDI